MNYHFCCWTWSPDSVFLTFLTSPTATLLSCHAPSMCFYIVPWKEVTTHRPDLRSGELCSSVLRTEFSDKIFGIFLLYLKFVSSASFIHLLVMVHQHGLMYTYFIFRAITQFYFIHLVAQIFPALALGALSVGFCFSLMYLW